MFTNASTTAAAQTSREVAALGGVYTITSRSTGRVYVGSSINIARRWVVHRMNLRLNRHHNIFLQRHRNQHGDDDLLFEVAEIENDPALRFGLETLLIRALYGAACFNHAKDGKAPGLGRTPSPEVRAKLSAALKGRKKSPESIRARGVTRAIPENAARTAARISASLTGKKLSPEHCALISARRIGVPLGPPSLSTRAKISAAQKGKVLRPESIAKRTATRLANRRAREESNV